MKKNYKKSKNQIISTTTIKNNSFNSRNLKKVSLKIKKIYHQQNKLKYNNIIIKILRNFRQFKISMKIIKMSK